MLNFDKIRLDVNVGDEFCFDTDDFFAFKEKLYVMYKYDIGIK